LERLSVGTDGAEVSDTELVSWLYRVAGGSRSGRRHLEKAKEQSEEVEEEGQREARRTLTAEGGHAASVRIVIGGYP
jgi:hypothetical protein